MSLKPFFPWMGSKRLLVKELMARVPRRYERYFEPFLGCGAMLYAMQPDRAFAADELQPVVDLHRAVASDPEGTAAAYRHLSLGCERAETFMSIRGRYPNIAPCEFLFLLKHCHGSRFRVNQKGSCNSALNRSPLKASTPGERGVANDVKAMLAVGAYSHKVQFAKQDFAESLAAAGPGDFVFLDPPYQWQAGKEADYGGQWGPAGWRRLAEAIRALPPGVHVMITLHGSMPLEEVEALLEGIPGMRVEAVELVGSHIKRGGMAARKEWVAMNYVQ